MTRSSLLALASLCAAAACGLLPIRRDPPPGASGRVIFDYQLCANCHGDDALGKGDLGPPLRSLGEHWTRAELVEFLADPDAWVEADERLMRLKEEYDGNMKPYFNLSEEERGVLADWLLTL